MQQFAGRWKAAGLENYTPANLLDAVFQRQMQECDVVSFDIFDTALFRYVHHPVDVFLHLERQAAFAEHAYTEPVSKLRIAAENSVRPIVFNLAGSYEVNLFEIYQAFCDQNRISRDCAVALTNAEELVEMRLCAPNRPILRLFEAAKAAGKRVIFVSDTYHRESFLLRLLSAHGYSVTPGELFASSASRKSKQSGLLFPHVLEAMGVKPERMLHVGDHPVSDFQEPGKLGIRSILHTHKLSVDAPGPVTQPTGPAASGQDSRMGGQSVVRGMVHTTSQAAEKQEREHDFWWKFGYSSAGPLTTGFCQWLEHRLRMDGMEHAYFMLRDGALLHQVYQLLYQSKAGACTVSTLPSSRRAALLPIVGLVPSFAVPSLLGGIGPRPMREYLERLGIPTSGFADEAVAAGLDSLDELVDGRIDSQRLLRFMQQERVKTALLARSAAERSLLERFLGQEKVTSHSKVALIDLGWGGPFTRACICCLLRARRRRTLRATTWPRSRRVSTA